VTKTGSKKIAALTGGTGFLGRYVARELAAKGYRLRLLARSLPVHPQLENLALEIIPGALDDDAACTRLVEGADLVVHCAGLIKARDRETFMKINGRSTARLAGLWANHQKNGNSRFVLVSSLAARAPDLSDYAASKRAGEDALREVDGNWLIIRPAAVYGPWDTETLQVFKALKWPLQPLLSRPGARLGLIHAEDMARAIVALGQKGKPGQIYEVSDDRSDGYSWEEIVAAAARAMAVKARTLRIPPKVVHGLGQLGGWASQWRKTPALLSPGKINEILHPDWAVDPAYAPPKKLWKPRIPLDQGFAGAISWYRAAGWL